MKIEWSDTKNTLDGINRLEMAERLVNMKNSYRNCKMKQRKETEGKNKQNISKLQEA